MPVLPDNLGTMTANIGAESNIYIVDGWHRVLVVADSGG